MTEETATNPETGVEEVPAVVEAVDYTDVHPDDRPDATETTEDDETGELADTSKPAAADDDEEEVEHNGKKYKLPKALAAERMMQADYTKKTTAHAEAVRAWETQRAAAQADDETTLEDRGKVYSLKAQMKLFDGVDWQGLNAQDPVEAQSLWFEREQAKAALAELEGGLQKKSAERLESQRANLATAMQETGRVLSRDIKDWSPALAGQIAAHGVEHFGIKPEEVQAMADPRVWKLLHSNMTQAAALKKQVAGERQATIQKVEPAKKVVAKAAPSATGLADNLSGAEWQRRRNAELAAKR